MPIINKGLPMFVGAQSVEPVPDHPLDNGRTVLAEVSLLCQV